MKKKEKSKRIMSLILTIIMILNVSTMVSANSLEIQTCYENDNISIEELNLSELSVGDVICINGVDEKVIEVSETGEVKTRTFAEQETFNNCSHPNGYLHLYTKTFNQYYKNNANMCYGVINISTNRCVYCYDTITTYSYGPIYGHKFGFLKKQCNEYSNCGYEKS